MLFLSTYINKIDKKGRFSVPAPYRAALAKDDFGGIVVFPSYKYAALEACSYGRMLKLSESVDDLAQFSDTRDDFTASLFASAHQLGFDNEGRVSLPAELMAHAGITDKIALVGSGATFQLWQPEAFAAHQQSVRQRTRQQPPSLPLKNPPSDG